jgi:3'(2'), 5'-bisphosphate nucleotidase
MNASERGDALARVLPMARAAAEAVMRVYAAGTVAVDYKGKDDPVTVADREANVLLCEALSRAFPGMPVVAEESDPASFAGWADAKAAWFVDPLDGTREFIARNGEFSVMIGLAEAGRATLGVIVNPAMGRAFVGALGLGAYEVATDGTRTPVHVSDVALLADADLVTSRSHRSARLDHIAARMGVRRITPCGGAGVKATRIATGEADVYVMSGRAGKRWDACAPEALVRAAGGVVSDERGAPFEYASGELDNVRGFVATNAALFDAVIERMQARPGKP